MLTYKFKAMSSQYCINHPTIHTLLPDKTETNYKNSNTRGKVQNMECGTEWNENGTWNGMWNGWKWYHVTKGGKWALVVNARKRIAINTCIISAGWYIELTQKLLKLLATMKWVATFNPVSCAAVLTLLRLQSSSYILQTHKQNYNYKHIDHKCFSLSVIIIWPDSGLTRCWHLNGHKTKIVNT